MSISIVQETVNKKVTRTLHAADGTLKVICPDSVRQGKIIYSDWIDTGLGKGYAQVFISVVDESGYDNGPIQEPRLISGRSELFVDSEYIPMTPDLECGFTWDTSSGRFRIAALFRRPYAGSDFKIYWTALMMDHPQVMKPERELFHIVNPPKKLHTGEGRHLMTNLPEGREILWYVTKGGGEISTDGFYKAPDKPGAYEVTATDKETGNITSCFIIVRN